MLWFEGSIPAAIVSAKQHNAVFLVVITGQDEQSTQMLSIFEDQRVSEATDKSFVAIKIDANSETCVQFSQIYPVVCIPSSFFIGENGIPLEVIAGSVPADELLKRIEKVKQMHSRQMGCSAVSSRPQEGAVSSQSTQSSPVDPPVEVCANAASKESLCGLTGDSGSPADDVSLSAQSDESLSARVDRLTKKLEERREQKRKGEEESEIKKEVERRKFGKEMLEYKRQQESEKNKRLLEERNREKAEERAARERVKQQIALDRAERAARYAKSVEEHEAAKASALQIRQAEEEARKESARRERSAVARIQFRLPDGSSFTSQFPSESRLQEARQFAAQEVGNRFGHFSLATMFPRREFTVQDMEKSLLDLELAPSASVVLLPQSSRPNNTVIRSSGGFWAVLGTLFYPLLAVWRFISSFLFTSPPAASAPPTRPGSTHPDSNRETVRKRMVEKRSEDFKRDGKVFRLRTPEDSEDDNNTWNGNSTQQM